MLRDNLDNPIFIVSSKFENSIFLDMSDLEI